MLKNQWSKKEIEDSEYEIHHRALSEEYSFFEAVKDGRPALFPCRRQCNTV